MPSLGPVPIPVPPSIAQAFPLKPHFGTTEEIVPQNYTHRFHTPGLKSEQRYWRGPGARAFRLRFPGLVCRDYETLRDHWHAARGVYASFDYTDPRSGSVLRVNYGDPVLRFEHAYALATGDPGLTLIENLDTKAPVTLNISHEEDGVPTDSFRDALRVSEQQLTPLVAIHTRDGATHLYLSDRACIVKGSEYLPRLLDWSGLTQATDQNADSASFRFGNADNVWTDLMKTISLQRARVNFSFFHHATGVLFHLWTGTVRD